MCVRFSGEGSSETYLAAVVVYVFLLVVWVMRIFCCHLFRRRFLKVIAFCPLPNPLPRGEGTDCRKSDNGRFSAPSFPLRGRGRIAESPIMVGFSTIIPSPWKRGQIAENPIIVGFSTIIPSPRGRGLGRGQNLRFSRFDCETQQILKP